MIQVASHVLAAFFSAEKFLLHGDAEHVVDGEVELLDLVRLVLRHADRDVGAMLGGDFAARAAGERDGPHTFRACHVERVEDVRRVAGRRDGEERVVFVAHAEHLLRKDEVGRLIVREGRAERDGVDERDRGERALEVFQEIVGARGAGRFEFRLPVRAEFARQQKAFHEFADDVLGIGRAAAVAAGDELAMVLVRRDQRFDGGCEVRLARGEDGGTGNQCGDSIMGRGFHIKSFLDSPRNGQLRPQLHAEPLPPGEGDREAVERVAKVGSYNS